MFRNCAGRRKADALANTPVMVRRLGLIGLALAGLAACNTADKSQAAAAAGENATSQASTATDDNKIECALNSNQWFERVCVVEQARAEDGSRILVVRHPDGGFRRFKVLTDGHGLAVADGAQEASTEVVDGRLDVQVGADRYRFPATVRGDGQGK